jgi:hypothetical protein
VGYVTGNDRELDSSQRGGAVLSGPQAQAFWRQFNVNLAVTFLSGTCGRFGRLFLDIEIKDRRLSAVGARNGGRIADVTEMGETSDFKVRQYFQCNF